MQRLKEKIELKVLPRRRVITGTQAIAEAVRLADVDVIAAYPIRPYTGVMNALAKMIADGEFDAEIIVADSEHSQFEIVKHASAVGARVFVGSSGTGLVYGAEAAVVTALGQLPVVAIVGCRALDDPGNFGMEWNDALLFRDVGWLITWVRNPQEAFDVTLISYRISEDRRVLLPSMIAVDGASITHIAAPVEISAPEKPKEFLPAYKPPYPLDPAFGPVTKAQHIAPSLIGPEQRKVIDVAMKKSREVIVEAYEDFARVFGRSYQPFVESYATEDAEAVLVCMGANSINAKYVVEKAREAGEDVGFACIRTFRPFPSDELRRVLQNAKVVGVIDFDYSFGSATYGGILFNEVRSALQELDHRLLTINFVAVGGRDVKLQQYREMLHMMRDAALKGRVEKQVNWVGLRGADL